MPAYYDSETGELLGVTQDIKTIQDKYPDRQITRDEDVLDTWFSSGLWPM
ncbi:class I tRNA ligase family protein [Candidatus Peregrinibacteria bacterium]|nr:class I tRNA ligase family protein [Candidatus Peregrinibacteria bacterium]MCB9805352.1 class I tRNA ligase family protein [Candidatus Peribacteria bacterium]